MIKAAVIGAGHLGKIHLKLLNQSERYELVGFYDLDKESSMQLSQEMGYTYYDDLDELISKVDMVDIVTPTLSHHYVALKAIEQKKNFFIEKPVTNTVAEANELIAKTKAAGLKAQVGHVERFNPAFTVAKEYIQDPLFIEAHRLAEFNPRGTDVPVVLDLMIHDLDIILSVVNSPVKEVRSSGVAIISETPDIANVRLQFENGCVANISTSRISMKNMRKCRFFQRDAYISVDFLDKKTEIIRMEDWNLDEADDGMVLINADKQRKKISFEYPEVKPNNAILDELESFADSIENDAPIAVTLEDARDALQLAYEIIDGFEAR